MRRDDRKIIQNFLTFFFKIINFVYGLPQLLQIIPCPRHRLPRFNSESGLREMSTTRFKISNLNIIGRLWVQIGSKLGLIWVKKLENEEVEINNLTNLNLTLKIVGPVSERDLTVILLVEQFLGVLVALFIRYYVAHLIYES